MPLRCLPHISPSQVRDVAATLITPGVNATNTCKATLRGEDRKQMNTIKWPNMDFLLFWWNLLIIILHVHLSPLPPSTASLYRVGVLMQSSLFNWPLLLVWKQVAIISKQYSYEYKTVTLPGWRELFSLDLWAASAICCLPGHLWGRCCFPIPSWTPRVTSLDPTNPLHF